MARRVTPPLLRYRTVGSTMDVLHELAARGAEAGTVVVAGDQSEGRGSRGRAWRSPPGGLWLSVLYRPPAAGVALVALRVGLAVAEAIEALGRGASVALKWPNDLMLGDRKVGGILCEARWHGEVLAWVVAGIGINVTNALPEEIAGGAVRLAEVMAGATAETLEPEVTARVRALDLVAGRLRPAELTELRRRDWLLDRRLRGPAPGTAAGISDDGALLVRHEHGTLTRVRAGTVELAEPSFTP